MRQLFVLALVSLTVLSVSVFANENGKIKKAELLRDLRAALSMKELKDLAGVDAHDKQRNRADTVRNILDREFSMPHIDHLGETDREALFKQRVEEKFAQMKERFQLPEDFKLPTNIKIPESFKERKLRKSL